MNLVLQIRRGKTYIINAMSESKIEWYGLGLGGPYIFMIENLNYAKNCLSMMNPFI